jgi:hypothetical protein
MAQGVQAGVFRRYQRGTLCIALRAPWSSRTGTGHSSIVVTMDTYGHLFPRSDDGAELAAAEAALLS